jgi:TonB-like protein
MKTSIKFKTATLLFIPLLLACFALSSTVPAAEPRFRPALISNGPKALVNVINTKTLMEKGQRDGLLMFKCYVDRSGKVGNYFIYRETPGSTLLKEEVGNALARSRFIPAIYNGEPTDVALLATVVFATTDGKPHLRIYANQNHGDVAKGNDFVAPQLLANTPDYVGSGYDLAGQKARVYGQNGWVQLSITVDANGNQKDLKVTLEDPPGFGVGAVAKNAYAKARWIPGFRNGHPVDCTFDYSEWFVTQRPNRPF